MKTPALAMLATMLLAGCAPATHQPGSDDDAMACVGHDPDYPACTLWSDFKSTDMHQAAAATCRQGGGEVASACPTENLAGTCDTRGDASQAWDYAHHVRRAVYRGARNNSNQERQACIADPHARWVPGP